MRRLLVALALVLFTMQGHAAEWEFVADLTDAVVVKELVPDPAHGRLLMGTNRGYRIYEPTTGNWILREPGETLGDYKVLCFLSDPFDSLALLTGREDLGWYGYIMDNTGLTEIGPIIMGGWDVPPGEEDRGGVWGLGRAVDNPTTLFACTIMFSAHGSVLRSEDGGASWESVLALVDSAWDLDIAPDGALLVAHGSPGYPYAGHGILRSADSGETWQEISGDMVCVGAIGDVAVDPSDPLHFYARQGGVWEAADPALGIYETLDGGLNWTQILQGNAIHFCMHPYDSEILVATLPYALMLSLDGGDSWQDISEGLPFVVGNELCAICPTDGRIYIADKVDGMWATDIHPTGVEQASGLLTGLSVYPSPFNPMTTVSFTLEFAGVVSLSIVDIGGRVVRRLLVAEAVQAGQQTMSWDGRDDKGEALPSGLYFAELRAAGSRDSRKLLLLK